MNLLDATLVFENCEEVTIPGKYVFYLFCGDFDRMLSTSNSFFDNYRYEWSDIIYDFTICILNDVNDDKSVITNFEDEENKYNGILNRIEKFHDIVGVHLKFDDGSDNYYFVNWGGYDDYTNASQFVYRNDFGDMLISISKNDYMDPFRHFKIDNLTDEKIMNDIRKYHLGEK